MNRLYHVGVSIRRRLIRAGLCKRAGWILLARRMQGDDCTAHSGQWWAGLEHERTKKESGRRKSKKKEGFDEDRGTRKRVSNCEDVAGYVNWRGGAGISKTAVTSKVHRPGKEG